MVETAIQGLVGVLLGEEIKDSLVGIVGKAVSLSVDKVTEKIYFCAYMEEFLKLQKNEIIVQQLQVLIGEMEREIRGKVCEQDMNLIVDLEKYLDEKFEEVEIDANICESLKYGLIQYVLVYIHRFNPTLYNEVILMNHIADLEVQTRNIVVSVAELERIVREMQNEIRRTHWKPISDGSNRLDVQDVRMLDTRDVEIGEIERKYKEGSNVVFLYGRPGIGKTTLAKLYANKVSRESDGKVKIYFEQFEKSIENTIAKCSNDLKKYNGKDILQYWRNCTSNEKENVLLIIDNFNEDSLQGRDRGVYEKELASEYFQELKNTGIRILITTRIKMREDVYEVQSVTDTMGLFQRYAGSEILESDRDVVEELIETLHGNTMLIRLTAYLWGQNKENGKLLLERFKNGLLKEQLDTVPVREDTLVDEKTIYGQAKALLDFSGIINDNEVRYVFDNMALLPLRGMCKTDFVRAIAHSNANVVNNLIDESWVLEEKEQIFLHPVIREILLEKEKITYETVRNYCESIGREIRMGRNFANRIEYKECAWEIFKMFSHEKQMEKALVKLIYDLSDIYDEIAERERSLEIANVVYEHLYVFNEDMLEKAQCLSGIAYSLNNCYKSMEDLNNAEMLLNEAQEAYERIDPRDVENMVEYKRLAGKIKNNKGSNCLSKGHCNRAEKERYYEEAQKYYQEAYDIRIDNKNRFILDEKSSKLLEGDIAISYTCLATVSFYCEEYRTAIEYHLKAYDIRKKINIKLANDNQQRIIGCIIKQQGKAFDVMAGEIKQALDFYPELLQNNRYFENYESLEININYFVLLSKIILNDKRYICLVDAFWQKLNLILNWLDADVRLKKKYEERIAAIKSL